MPELQILDSENIDDFLAQDNFVLILGKSDCVACNAWQSEIESSISENSFPEIAIAKLNLDQRGLGDFKRGNEWLKDIQDLPFNVIYMDGEIAKSYAGAGTERLTNRLKKLELIDS